MSEAISAFSIYRTEQRLNKSDPIISKKAKKTQQKPKVIPIENTKSKDELVERMIELKKFDLNKKRLSKKEKINKKKIKFNRSLNSSLKHPVEQSTPILKKQKSKASNGVSSSFESDGSVIMVEGNDTLHGSVVERNVIQKNTSENITEYNSIEVGKKLFEWVISPIKHEIFFK